jgi:hypothetical protein
MSLHSADRDAPDVAHIWGTRVPTKIKFFGWLLHFGPLSTRANLHRKNIRPLEDSYCDFCPATLETDDHIFLSCPWAISVWSMLGVEVQARKHRAPWLLAFSLPLLDDVRTDIFVTILSHIWKARNSKILEQQTLSP